MLTYHKNVVLSFLLTFNCNFHCKYCLRNVNEIHTIPEFTVDTVRFLNSLTPDTVKAFVVTGGEPLLYFGKIKELFSYLHPGIEKRVVTNASLLSKEIVDYFNEHNIVLRFSHDGPMTKFLRGKDVLADESLCSLIRSVNRLMCNSVITRYNVNVWENFFDTITKLRRNDLAYSTFPIMDFGVMPDMIRNFDYDIWFATWTQFMYSRFQRHSITDVSMPKRKLDIALLPDGRFISCIHSDNAFGSIYDDSFDILKQRFYHAHSLYYCKISHCKFKEVCYFPVNGISEHACRCRKMVMEHCYDVDFRKSVAEYVSSHFTQIKEKYGYVKA